MKKIILVLLLLVGYSQAQDLSISVLDTYKDTLTATIDTVIVYFQTPAEYFKVKAKTASGTDTIYVDCMGVDGEWVNKSLVGLFDKVLYSLISATTTSREYLIYDPEIKAVRFRNTTGDSQFIINAIRQGK